ncbi:hypothetical protein ISCGN_008938 [Ixodes scapularis]
MQQGQETADAASVRPVASLHGFQFHSRCQKIDWRKIASVDVDKVAREVDVDSLQKNVVHLTFCDIDNELGGALVDPNFLKLFKLAQLCIEYLMHSQELLLQSLSDVENQVAGTSRLLEEERKFRLCDQEAIRQLQRENRKRKRIIENQQLEMLKGDKLIATGAGFTYVAPSVLEELHRPTVIKARSPRKLTNSPRPPFSPAPKRLVHPHFGLGAQPARANGSVAGVGGGSLEEQMDTTSLPLGPPQHPPRSPAIPTRKMAAPRSKP